tara:strand:+ start:73790 stop:74236 length:447 start_codon:yes stop_codon:yes gene_type:complete
MNAKDIMTSNPITLNQNKLVKDAADVMTDKGISVLPIIDDNDNLVGIITESDFVGKAVEVPHALVSIKQIFKENFNNASVEAICSKARNKVLKDVMSTNLKTVNENSSLDEIINLMITKNVKRIPVVNGDKITGIITRKDIVKAYAGS